MGELRFVVQLHRARRLHYDFRLEVDGALVSWAVPKGPSLDPKIRRAAFHVDDHPMEYVAFEGVIPSGTYGGGDVIVWDTGSWVPYKDPDPRAALDNGELHIELHGEKLRGKFVIVRTRRDEWLLLKKRDEHAADGWDAAEHPLSVLSGRSSDEVKADPEWQWRSDLPADRAAIRVRAEDRPPDPAAIRVRAEDPPAIHVREEDPPAIHVREEDPPAIRVRDEDLRALDEIGENGTWEVFGRRLRVTNLGKELFAGRDGEDAVTKRELLRYTAGIAPTVVPYLAGRALNLHRFPNGTGAKGFWQKALPSHAPEWLTRWREPDSGTEYLVADEPAALVWAANYGGLEWHPWTSKVDRPGAPTYALVDLDPGPDTAWEDLLVLARLHRTAFEHLGVAARAKVSGRRGIQIWVPVDRGPGFAETRAWVEGLSRSVGAVVPDLVSWAWEKAERGGRARLDFTQNAVNRTLVAPYSPRAAPGAPVSAPIDWDELDDPALRPDAFTIRTIGRRLADRGDLFADVLHTRQHLKPLQ